MLPRLVQKLTAILALALVGLVGGIGTALHVSLDCCCDHSHGDLGFHTHEHGHQGHSHRGCCHHNCCKNRASTEDHRSQSTQVSLAKTAAECSICKLLASYHSTEIQETTQAIFVTDGDFFLLPAPVFIADASAGLEPSRGPPVAVF